MIFIYLLFKCLYEKSRVIKKLKTSEYAFFHSTSCEIFLIRDNKNNENQSNNLVNHPIYIIKYIFIFLYIKYINIKL